MTSLSNSEAGRETFFLSRHDGIKPIIRSLHSASSSRTSATLLNHPLQLSSSSQQLQRTNLEEKIREWTNLQIRYETKINELETQQQQLQIHSGQIDEENKRLKIALEHEKQRAKIEQTSLEHRIQSLENECKEKRIFIDHEKREQTRIYDGLLRETNQRLKKMEHDHKSHQGSNQKIVDEMEQRLGDLRLKIDQVQQSKENLHEEKLHLIKQNEQLQLQVQELTNKQQQIDRDHHHRYENDLKSQRIRYETLRKEHEVLKKKSTKIIDDLEQKITSITEQVSQMQKLSQEKFLDQRKTIQHLEKDSQENKRLKQLYEQLKQLTIESKLTQENNKKKLVQEYEQFIEKLEREFSQKIADYEKRMEILIDKTHEQWKSIEDDLEIRNSKQSAIITDQQKLIDTFKDEQIKAKFLYEQTTREKNEIKQQFDDFMKNFQTISSKKEQLERKLSYLVEEHKHQLIECRLSYENHLKGLLTNDIRVDLETTIDSLKQQILFLQQRIAFLQQELDQYIQLYGHRPAAV